MRRTSISETKNQLSALIDRVRNGERILITDRNRPVAQLVPVAEGSAAPSDVRLGLLERAGWQYLQTWYPASRMMGVVEGAKA